MEEVNTNYYSKTVYNGRWKRFTYNAIDAYVQVENPEQWLDCPNCGMKPLVWEFSNGRSTACGCGKNKYDHFSIHAESIMSAINNSPTGKSAMDYDIDALRKNWNHWVQTGKITFETAQHRTDGRW